MKMESQETLAPTKMTSLGGDIGQGAVMKESRPQVATRAISLSNYIYIYIFTGLVNPGASVQIVVHVLNQKS
jgi:hypothetical protein